ncbi:uncharacterized protein LOC111829918 [Capsella rubella]|uniref:uncharacterized protein LOC111829918 n=1 Tax=Capsella rubella TaxID=81985 RepID=UPI000CD571A4|nr:uncharacterized protein LOC111829918 [Capsella rubella]
MRNDLIFNNKRWSIPDTINKALVEFNLWKESLDTQIKSPEKVPELKPREVQHIRDSSSDIRSIIQSFKHHCCFVDGSWVSPTDCAGIAWILYDNKAQPILKGSASISPMSSPLEVEAEALRQAVLNVRRLGYDNVIFCGDASILYDNIKLRMLNAPKGWCKDHSLIATLSQDIRNMATSFKHVSFCKISRSVNYATDSLAKNARVRKLCPVIC